MLPGTMRLYRSRFTRLLALLGWLASFWLVIWGNATWAEQLDHQLEHIAGKVHFQLSENPDHGDNHHSDEGAGSHVLHHITIDLAAFDVAVPQTVAVYSHSTSPTLRHRFIGPGRLERPPRS